MGGFSVGKVVEFPQLLSVLVNGLSCLLLVGMKNFGLDGCQLDGRESSFEGYNESLVVVPYITATRPEKGHRRILEVGREVDQFPMIVPSDQSGNIFKVLQPLCKGLSHGSPFPSKARYL